MFDLFPTFSSRPQIKPEPMFRSSTTRMPAGQVNVHTVEGKLHVTFPLPEGVKGQKPIMSTRVQQGVHVATVTFQSSGMGEVNDDGMYTATSYMFTVPERYNPSGTCSVNAESGTCVCVFKERKQHR